jgi:mono/diheme cytochrome c family protein
MSSDIANDIPEMVKGMPSVSSIKQIIHNWSRTQTWSTREQLDNGVRYLDVRVSRPEVPRSPNEVRAVHGL